MILRCVCAKEGSKPAHICIHIHLEHVLIYTKMFLQIKAVDLDLSMHTFVLFKCGKVYVQSSNHQMPSYASDSQWSDRPGTVSTSMLCDGNEKTFHPCELRTTYETLIILL